MKTLLKILGAALGLLVVVVGVAMAMAWAPDKPLAELAPRWAPAPSQFIEVNGLKAHVRDEGPRDDSQPIVLLHGTSASLHTWDGWVTALKGQRRVIRVDLPGFGLTGPAPDNHYEIGHYTDFLTALMDKLGVKQAVVAGNSFGGYVAWKTAVDHPARVSRLVLVDAGGYNYVPQSVPIGFKLAMIPALKPLTTHLLTRGMIESSVRSVYGDPKLVTPELVERYYELTLREGNRAALSSRFAQSKGGEFEAQIKQVKQPTLIIWGGQDKLIPPEYANRFKKDIAGSRVAMFDGLGHVPHEEDPQATVEAVQAFLAQWPSLSFATGTAKFE